MNKILEGFITEWALRSAVKRPGWKWMYLHETATEVGMMNVLVVPIPKGAGEEARRLIEEALNS